MKIKEKTMYQICDAILKAIDNSTEKCAINITTTSGKIYKIYTSQIIDINVEYVEYYTNISIYQYVQVHIIPLEHIEHISYTMEHVSCAIDDNKMCQ